GKGTFKTATGSNAKENTFSKTGIGATASGNETTASITQSGKDAIEGSTTSGKGTFKTATGSDANENTFSKTGIGATVSSNQTTANVTQSGQQTTAGSTKAGVSITGSASETGAATRVSTADTSAVSSADNGRGVESSGTRTLHLAGPGDLKTLDEVEIIINKNKTKIKEAFINFLSNYQDDIPPIDSPIITDIINQIKAIKMKGSIESQTRDLENMIDGLRTGTKKGLLDARKALKEHIRTLLM
ncbi:MAG: hypothetical protein H0X29_03245, partial [Parachlamydiaceae bacterium]|nr:hypothetical protein [Parachlamydiaceae bacterium]